MDARLPRGGDAGRLEISLAVTLDGHVLMHALILIIFIVAAGVLWFGPPIALKLAQRARLARHCGGRGVIALTYDDGPGDQLTRDLLQLLAEHQARVSFFFLGKRVGQHPELARQIAQSGHEIGSHSESHKHAWKCVPGVDVADLWRGARRTADLEGPRRLIRPPYGKLTTGGLAVALACRGRFAWWTIDSGDTWKRLPSVDSVVDAVARAGGGVVLLHDFQRSGVEAASRHEFVLETTRRLLDLARTNGWRVVTVGELIS